MEEWLFLGILSYASYAVSTSIDKTVMNRGADALSTNTLKSLLDGCILLSLGILTGTRFSTDLLIYSVILGGIYATSGVVYFKLLHEMDVQAAIPLRQSASTLLIFALSVPLLSEIVNLYNAVGAVLVSSAIFLILSKKGLKLPKYDKGLKFLGISILLATSYSLLTKVFVSDYSVLALSSTMYFSATLFQVLYQLYFREKNLAKTFTTNFGRVSVAAVFGATGTYLLYSALKLGQASQVYPLMGVQSVFIFLISTSFLDEETNKRNIIGILLAFLGIYLVQV